MIERHPSLTRVRAMGDGVAITAQHSVLRLEDGEWSETAGDDALWATWGSGPGAVGAVGDGGRVLRWDGSYSRPRADDVAEGAICQLLRLSLVRLDVAQDVHAGYPQQSSARS